MTRLLSILFLIGLFCAAAAQAASVRVSRAAEERSVAVMVDQAVIVESDRSFVEVQIAQPDIADVQPLTDRSLYLLGLRRGRTSVALIDGNGGVIANLRVEVQPDVSELKLRLSELLPRAPIEVRALGDGVALSGVVGDSATVVRAMALARAYAGEDVTNLLTVGSTQQVSLKVRIAEINRTAAKELGIGVGADRAGDPAISAQSGRPAFAPATGFGAVDALFSVGGSLLLNVSIDALESKGFARVLAEPNLVALSGGEAEFLAGGEVPIPLISADGDVDVEYRPIGVSLNFRPTVLEDDAISMAVSAEVADVDPNLGVSTPQTDIPGFVVRRATTSVELRDGQSFAIAGLYQDDFTDQVAQVPWLGEIPVLGALFRSVDYQRGETELVVIVSATLVEPVGKGTRIAAPTDRVRAPTEAEFFLFGQSAAAAEGPAFDGPVGYAFD